MIDNCCEAGGAGKKYIVVLGDGMADEPFEALGGRTPLEAANTPNMDDLAGKGELGLAKTVPDGMRPGSDVANLAVLGYDPQKSYSGRSPLEALSIGVPMSDDDVVFRCNLVTLSEGSVPYEERVIIDHSAGEITTEEADQLMDAIRARFDSDKYRFYTGTSYRHITVWHSGEVLDMCPPHDHLDCVIGDYLPSHPDFLSMMKESYDILNDHPINQKRAASGKRKANSLWFWGAGTRPSLENFTAMTGKRGAMISAVDLLKGIATGAGMKVVAVEGADGTLDTNYEGKAHAAVKTLLEDGCDVVYIHIEAPDEMGHQGSVERKIKAIENVDSRVLAVVKREMDASGVPYRILLMPDHPTPISKRTHTSDPVPYVLYDSTRERRMISKYSEREAAATGNYEPFGYKLMARLLEEQ